jgi:hypothetical protein
VNRLAWAGHVVCKNNDRVIKKIFSTKPKGVKTAGRRKLRLEEGMSQDMKTLVSRTGRMLPATLTNGQRFENTSVKNWKNAACDTDEWTKI